MVSVGAIATVLIAAMMGHACGETVSIAQCISLLSITLACMTLALLAVKKAELKVLLGEVIQVLVLFYASVGLCGSMIMLRMTKRGVWFLLPAFSIPHLVIDCFEVAVSAKHWETLIEEEEMAACWAVAIWIALLILIRG